LSKKKKNFQKIFAIFFCGKLIFLAIRAEKQAIFFLEKSDEKKIA
jgi:hypothetical protein